jgi:putative transposase
MQQWQQWEAASEADWGVAVEREMVIRPLAEHHQLSTHDVDEAISRLRVSRSLFYRLIHRYRQRPQTSSLLPWKRGRDKNVKLLDQDREQLLDTCIKALT